MEASEEMWATIEVMQPQQQMAMAYKIYTTY
jgi:hypothetical protein